jgi:hypothetical protein
MENIYKIKLEEEKKLLEDELKSIGQVDKTGDYEENIKKNGEDKFPEELRWVYPSGIKKSGSSGGNKMPPDLVKDRDQYIVDNQEKFSKVLIKNATERLKKDAYK